jgi:hypothetical protein
MAGLDVGNFQVTCSFCPHSVAQGTAYPVTEISTKEFPGGSFAEVMTAICPCRTKFPNKDGCYCDI